ncbi:MAG: preprotein translocase subunit SecE [Candidatus Pacebacteria bacterium]|nr:preprotein translocase subunit SecE [Candidatus Paceibacterota bacterium]
MSNIKGFLKKPLIFLSETKQELKKASWPTRQETMRLTGIVVFVSVITAALIGFLDFSFTKLVELIVRR